MNILQHSICSLHEYTTTFYLQFSFINFLNGPKGDNTDWVKDIAVPNKNNVTVGDFNAHPLFGKTDVP